MSETPIAAGYRDWEWHCYDKGLEPPERDWVLVSPASTEEVLVTIWRDGTIGVDHDLSTEDFAALSRIVLAKLHELRRGSLPPATDYESALAYALDREHAIALRELMSEISECATAARWVSGLECDLWAELQTGEGEYGIEPARMERLRNLSEKSGGWWYSPEKPEWGLSGIVFISLAAWLVKYQKSLEIKAKREGSAT